VAVRSPSPYRLALLEDTLLYVTCDVHNPYTVLFEVFATLYVVVVVAKRQDGLCRAGNVPTAAADRALRFPTAALRV
jgi:ABC-type antimicrobial peptide transport system permease subunit